MPKFCSVLTVYVNSAHYKENKNNEKKSKHLSQLIHPMGGVRANPFSSPSTPFVPIIISKITRGCILGESIPETSSKFIIKGMSL